MSKVRLAALGALVVVWMAGPLQAAGPEGQPQPESSVQGWVQAGGPETYPAAPPNASGVVTRSPAVVGWSSDHAVGAWSPDHANHMGGCCAPSVHMDEGCCPGDCGWHIYADGGFVLVKPHLQNNLAYRAASISGITFGAQDQSFNHDTEIGPRVSLGITESSSGLGARVRWFNLDEDTRIIVSPTAALAISPPAFAGISGSAFPAFANSRFTDRIRMDVWDVEGTQDVRTGAWSLLISAGARYAHLVENYRYHSPFNTADTSFGTIRQNRSFDGFGPMMGLEARRPIGCTGITLFAIGRGGVLFGDGTNNGIVYTTSPGGVTVLATYDAPHEDVIPVVELELGAEWSRAIGRFQPFIQTAFVAQNYFGFNSATAGGGGTTSSPTIQAGGNLGLIGLALNAGLRF